MPQSTDNQSGPWGPRPDPAIAGAPSLVTVPSAEPAPIRSEFVGSRRAFSQMMLSGLTLYIPTFGFNRFWLRTGQRRFHWLNTRVDGDSFEYRGTARELAVGFLFAVAIYLPLAAVYSLAGLYAETYQSYAAVPFAILTFAFGHFAAFRARRYRLTRTAFRGIRFWMRGSGVRYGIGAFGWVLASGLTLGIGYFWMQAWLERTKMACSSYGDLPGRFEGSGWGLMRACGVPGIVIALMAAGFVFWFLFTLARAFAGLSSDDGMSLLFAPVFLLFFVPVAWSVLSVIKTRWWLSGIRFGAVALETRLRSTAMIGSALKTTLLTALAVAIWAGLAAIVGRTFGWWQGVTGFDTVFSDLRAAVLFLLCATVALIIGMYVKSVFYNFDFAKRVIEATTVTGLETIATVSAAGTPEGIIGEGLADALGADGF